MNPPPKTTRTAEEITLGFRIALTMVNGVGGTLGRNLISYLGSAQEIFKASKTALMKVPGIGEKIADAIKTFDGWERVEKELDFIRKQGVQTFFFTDKNYPQRFKHHPDTPLLLYYKGSADLNAKRTIGIVGTRKSTDYGRALTEKLVQELAPHEPVVISGLAYGIDAAAHKAALQYNLPTIGVMGTGLHKIYPSEHRGLANKMTLNGGLLTEFSTTAKLGPENFAARNRLVAALSDVVIIVESAANGGALITAEQANDYSKEVMTFPGRVGDKYSEGCHQLIKKHKATLIESAQDVSDAMGWNDGDKPQQRQLLFDLTDDEKIVTDYLRDKPHVQIDELTAGISMPPSLLAVTLLGLEMKGAVLALPGKRFRLI